MRRLAIACLLSSLAAPAATQQPQQQHSDTSRRTPAVSPYSEYMTREIKALSPQQVSQYRLGEGMGMALAAELNHYAGPRHVLELADSLGLSDEQHRRVVAAMEMMRTQAIRLGEEIIAKERELDRAFASGTISERQLRQLTGEIGRLQGALRALHLAAHMATTRELTPVQMARYERLRGYAGGSGHHH